MLTATVMSFLAVMFFNAPSRSVEPMLQIRAAELGQSLMDEILAKPFDELTPLGGYPPCSSCSASLGKEGTEARDDYDDVDDYNYYCNPVSPVSVSDAFGNLPGDA